MRLLGKHLSAALLACVPFAAAAQQSGGQPPVPTEEQTLQDISRRLEHMQHTLRSNEADDASNSSSKTTGVGQRKVAAKAITGFSSPNRLASAVTTFKPGTQFEIEGAENGFLKLAPLLDNNVNTASVFVPEREANASFGQSLVDDAMSEVMKQVASLATDLRNNPWVRLKGFQIHVSVPPGVDIEFEMRAQQAADGTASQASH